MCVSMPKLGGSGGMLPKKILQVTTSETGSGGF